MQAMKQAARAFWRDGDHWLFLLCLGANLYGLLLIYSATRYAPALETAIWKQLAAMSFGIVLYILLSFLDVETLTERLHKVMLVTSFALLLLLVPFGNDDGTGNKSWISLPGTPFNVQPTELVKILFVLLLAYQFQQQEPKGVSRPLSVLLTAGQTLLLCAVIFLVSRDLGMVLLYLAIYLVMAFSARVHGGWFLLFFALGAAMVYFLWPYLPGYIQMRLLVVLDHDLDPQGKGFQQLRSLLAIGSGQLRGQGLFRGIQTQNSASSALPARHTDFIFSVAGEELGLWGALLILLLLAAITLRCLWLAGRVNSPFCRYVAVGFGGMVAVQTTLNVGMCLYMAPVVGLTLPFFSYGGSSLITMYIAMGILSGMKLRAGKSRWRAKSPLSEGV